VAIVVGADADAARGDRGAVVNKQLAFWCKAGHEMTEDNTRLGRSGEPLCRQCLKNHLAAARRWGGLRPDGPAGKEKKQ
jgi:hypothetical protein